MRPTTRFIAALLAFQTYHLVERPIPVNLLTFIMTFLCLAIASYPPRKQPDLTLPEDASKPQDTNR